MTLIKFFVAALELEIFKLLKKIKISRTQKFETGGQHTKIRILAEFSRKNRIGRVKSVLIREI